MNTVGNLIALLLHRYNVDLCEWILEQKVLNNIPPKFTGTKMVFSAYSTIHEFLDLGCFAICHFGKNPPRNWYCEIYHFQDTTALRHIDLGIKNNLLLEFIFPFLQKLHYKKVFKYLSHFVSTTTMSVILHPLPTLGPLMRCLSLSLFANDL